MNKKPLEVANGAHQSIVKNFDLSIIKRIRLLKVRLSARFVLDKSFVRRRYLLTSWWGGGTPM